MDKLVHPLFIGRRKDLMKKFLILKWAPFFLVIILIPSLTTAQATYMGSKKCMSCHNSIHEMWKDTLHNKSQQISSRTNDTLAWIPMLVV